MTTAGWLAFGSLAVGARFRFVYGAGGASLSPSASADVFTKVARGGWYATTTGRKFRTGLTTAVAVVEG